MLRKKFFFFFICFTSFFSTLGITTVADAEEITLSQANFFTVQPDSVSRSNIWIKGTAPYVYYQEQAYGTLYRGYLGLDTVMPNGWGIYKGKLYRLGLPYPIPSRLIIEKGGNNSGK